MSLPRGAVVWSAMCDCGFFQEDRTIKRIRHKGENCVSVYTFQKNASCVSFGMWCGGGGGGGRGVK